jgi:hypothetical protein
MSKKFEFDPIAYRRLNLRWLLAALAASLVLDIVIISVWLATDASPANQYFVDIGMGFLCLLNQGLKAVTLFRYSNARERLSKCYLQTDGNQIVHYQFIAGMSRGRQAAAAETILPRSGQRVFEWSETLYIRNVDGLRLKRNGSIEVLGTNISKYSPDYDFDSVGHRTVKRHLIPPYYECMDELYASLESLRKQPDLKPARL